MSVTFSPVAYGGPLYATIKDNIESRILEALENGNQQEVDKLKKLYENSKHDDFLIERSKINKFCYINRKDGFAVLDASKTEKKFSFEELLRSIEIKIHNVNDTNDLDNALESTWSDGKPIFIKHKDEIYLCSNWGMVIDEATREFLGELLFDSINLDYFQYMDSEFSTGSITFKNSNLLEDTVIKYYQKDNFDNFMNNKDSIVLKYGSNQQITPVYETYKTIFHKVRSGLSIIINGNEITNSEDIRLIDYSSAEELYFEIDPYYGIVANLEIYPTTISGYTYKAYTIEYKNKDGVYVNSNQTITFNYNTVPDNRRVSCKVIKYEKKGAGALLTLNLIDNYTRENIRSYLGGMTAFIQDKNYDQVNYALNNSNDDRYTITLNKEVVDGDMLIVYFVSDGIQRSIEIRNLKEEIDKLG